MAAVKVFRFDASGCNGCDIEIVSAVVDPAYGISSLVEVVDAPEKAGVMLVTGGGNEKTIGLLKEAYEKLQDPKLVIAMGACANSMCVFKRGYNMRGPPDTVIPVNFFIMGCPPKPQTLARAVHAILEVDHDYTGQVWMAPDGLRARIAHYEEKCTACGSCANMCPSEAITLVEDGNRIQIVYDMWRCSFCGTCQVVCPEEAVVLTDDYAMFFPKKELAVEHGCMSRDQCACCGAQMHTIKQRQVIKARILEKRPEFAEFRDRIDASTGLCQDCKRDLDYISRNRRDMMSWAYDAGEVGQ